MSNSLEEVYKSSAGLMKDVTENHQDVTDFCYALRFLLKMTPGCEMFVAGIDKLLLHIESLKRLSTSYHTAVGETIDHAAKRV